MPIFVVDAPNVVDGLTLTKANLKTSPVKVRLVAEPVDATLSVNAVALVMFETKVLAATFAPVTAIPTAIPAVLVNPVTAVLLELVAVSGPTVADRQWPPWRISFLKLEHTDVVAIVRVLLEHAR